MSSDTYNYLDGNAAAGQLSGVFAMDVTSAEGCCANCGTIKRFAEAHFYIQCPEWWHVALLATTCSFVL